MNINLIITLLVMIFMIVSFVIQKWSYGLTAMTCVVVLTLAGVIDVQTAFSGFSNTTTVLIATMIVIAGQLSRTSLISRIRSLMAKAQNKGGFLLILLICAFTALLTQLMGMTAVMAIMLLFVQTLKDDDASGISQSKMIFLCATMICTWFGRFPIGMGAALPLTTNAYYEGLVGGDSSQLLGIFDFMKVGLLPSIIGTIYCLFAWRLVPKQELRTDAVDLGHRAWATGFAKDRERQTYERKCGCRFRNFACGYENFKADRSGRKLRRGEHFPGFWRQTP